MKKLVSILITLCALACAAGFWMIGGSQFLELQAGPRALGPEEAFSQAEGKYVSYEAAYPVASYVEEYYSGDPDRVRKIGYVVYDEGRGAFLYVVVSEQEKRDLSDLLWNLHLVAELREGKDMTPYTVKGTLESMEQDDLEHIYAALGESEVIDLYLDIQDSAETMEAYFSDSYGETIVGMCESLDEILQQADWYRIENGVVSGLETMDIWVCALAAGFSLLIFVVRLASLFIGGKKKPAADLAISGSRMERFYEKQWEQVKEWCAYSLNRGRWSAYLTVIGCTVVLVVIGVIVKVPTERLIAFYLALGVLIGEVIAVICWCAAKGQAKPDKIMKRFAKNIGKMVPSAADQEEIAEDILQTGPEWDFKEKTKTGMLWGTVGSRYWVVLHWNGRVAIIDSQKLERIETEVISGQVRSGKVRVNYETYAARFYYKSETPKKSCDESLSFDVRDNLGDLMLLARKRVGGSVEFKSC